MASAAQPQSEIQIPQAASHRHLHYRLLLRTGKTVYRDRWRFPLEPLQAEYDEARTAFLEDAGYSMIRFTNDDVRHDLDAVVEAIVSKVDSIVQES